MNRDNMLARISDKSYHWEIIIIGGGATGLGCAIDAASRGYKTLLLEQSDFGKGTSSRSTKLVHGGVRYLQQGNVALVLEALKERGIMLRNAPHLVHNLPFIVPNYDWWEGPFYGIGMKLYDMLAGREGFGSSRMLSKEETIAHLPTIETKGLNGGVIYYDGQFDDARLIINMAQTAAGQGAAVLNYCPVTRLLKRNGLISGLIAVDQESGREFELQAEAVINATGAFSDDIRIMDDPSASPIIVPSQGAHLVLDREFLPGDSAIMVPHTDDGRVLFAIPWHNRVVVGTTDTPVEKAIIEPRPLSEEIEFLLTHASRYLTKDPSEKDARSVFAGLRPLVGAQGGGNTAALSRDHTIIISRFGLLTVTGGKWTTYRRMAEDAVDHTITIGQLEPRPCVTKELNIHGFHRHAEEFGPLAVYGSDAPALLDMMRNYPEFNEQIHPALQVKVGQIKWAVEREMARTVEDFLARRTRELLLDARASMDMAPVVTQWMARFLQRNNRWEKEQTRQYHELAKGYILNGSGLR
jgi:glycerol-3-phosphate dehydrogenase